MFLKKIWKELPSLLCLFVACILSLIIFKSLHNSLEIPSIWVFLFKLLPFIFALAFISLFPFDKFKTPLKLLLILFAFAVIFSYCIGKLIYYFVDKPVYVEFYLLLQIMTPLIILSLALALRCGGMDTKDVAIFGVTGIILMVSGIEDLVSQIVRVIIVPGYTIPETWNWARHITVFLGHVTTKNEAYVFISIHFVIIFFILYFAYTKNNPYTWIIKNIVGRRQAGNGDQ